MKNNKYLNIIKNTLSLYSEHEMNVYSGYATLYILMAMIPLLMLAISLINMTPWISSQDFYVTIEKILPELPDIQNMIKSIINNLSHQSGSLIASVSAITTLWSASNGLTAIQNSLEEIQSVRRSNLKGKPAAILFTLIVILALPTLIIMQFLRTSLTEKAMDFISDTPIQTILQKISGIINHSQIITVFIVILLLLCMYTYLPKGKRSMKAQIPGAVLATIAIMLFSAGFAFFIPRFWKASSLYGSLASIFLLAMWLKIIIMIIFYGACLNRVLSDQENHTENAPETF